MGCSSIVLSTSSYSGYHLSFESGQYFKSKKIELFYKTNLNVIYCFFVFGIFKFIFIKKTLAKYCIYFFKFKYNQNNPMAFPAKSYGVLLIIYDLGLNIFEALT